MVDMRTNYVPPASRCCWNLVEIAASNVELEVEDYIIGHLYTILLTHKIRHQNLALMPYIEMFVSFLIHFITNFPFLGKKSRGFVISILCPHAHVLLVFSSLSYGYIYNSSSQTRILLPFYYSLDCSRISTGAVKEI